MTRRRTAVVGSASAPIAVGGSRACICCRMVLQRHRTRVAPNSGVGNANVVSSNRQAKHKTATLVGGVVGGIMLVALAAVVCYIRWMRRRRQHLALINSAATFGSHSNNHSPAAFNPSMRESDPTSCNISASAAISPARTQPPVLPAPIPVPKQSQTHAEIDTGLVRRMIGLRTARGSLADTDVKHNPFHESKILCVGTKECPIEIGCKSISAVSVETYESRTDSSSGSWNGSGSRRVRTPHALRHGRPQLMKAVPATPAEKRMGFI